MKISHKVRMLLTALLVVALCLSIVPVMTMAAGNTRSDISFPTNNPGGPAEEEEDDIRIPIGSLPTKPTEPPTEPSEPAGVPGDMNSDGIVTNDDVVVLLWHCLFPEDNPLPISGDLNGDEIVTNDDVVVLLWHCLFPEDNPLS